MLNRMAVDLLSKGTGLSGSLADVLRNTFSKRLLSLSLESVYGPLFTTGDRPLSSSDNNRNLLALPALVDAHNTEKRFFFAMSDTRWEVLSAFSCNNEPFFTTLTLDISDPSSTAIKSGLFKLVDYFTVQCKKLLQHFIDEAIDSFLLAPPSGEQYVIEKNMLRKLTVFSGQVQCAVLLDEDGFIIHTEGPTGSVDELGSMLARLFYRSNHAISRLKCTDCSAITITDHEYTIRIGRLPGTSLALAVSICGPYAVGGAHFLHATGSKALVQYAKRTGKLWGVALADIPAPVRKRDSWFGPATLIPHGKFVGKKGGKSFHASTCQILSKTDTGLLTWFDSRSTAIQQGLRPCGVCIP